MASYVTLDKLIHAIAGSVMEAQHLVEKAQVDNITSFFDEKRQPKCFEVELPSMRSSAHEGEFDRYRLPLISLIAHSSLVISEAEIELDVELDGVSDDHPSQAGVLGREQFQKPSLMVNPEGGGGSGKKGANVAHITLKLASSDPSEGMSRLITEVIKVQGVVGPSKPAVPPEPSS